MSAIFGDHRNLGLVSSQFSYYYFLLSRRDINLFDFIVLLLHYISLISYRLSSEHCLFFHIKSVCICCFFPQKPHLDDFHHAVQAAYLTSRSRMHASAHFLYRAIELRVVSLVISRVFLLRFSPWKAEKDKNSVSKLTLVLILTKLSRCQGYGCARWLERFKCFRVTQKK